MWAEDGVEVHRWLVSCLGWAGSALPGVSH